MFVRIRSVVSLCAAVLVLAVAFGAAVAEQGVEQPAEAAAEVAEVDLLYAIGVVMARNLEPLSLNAAELEQVQQGIADAATGKETRVDPTKLAGQLDAFLRGRMQETSERKKADGAEFAEKAALEPGAVRTESGLVFLEKSAGNGASPAATDTVRIHYTGTFPDGTVFDTSRAGEVEQPAEFRLDQVIQCFSEGIQRMKVGGSSRLVCPPDIAYGDRGFPPKILPGSTLVFDVELLEIVENAEAAAEANASEDASEEGSK
jgi:FKBP-type peptidyl-prolyl cis-trans isomerase